MAHELFPIYKDGEARRCDEATWPVMKAEGWSKSEDEAPAEADADPSDSGSDDPAPDSSDSPSASADPADPS